MKPKYTFLLLIAVAVVTAALTWQLASQHSKTVNDNTREAGTTTRRIKFYQSPMHPWITSDKPGKCTVCGMDLVAVFEGDTGFGGTENGVRLSSNIVQVLNVRSDTVGKRPLIRTIQVAGVLEDDDTRHRILSAYVDGRVDRLFVNYVGAEVESGQALASIYSPMLLNAEREYLVLRKEGGGGSSPAEHKAIIDAARDRLLRLGLSAAQIEHLETKSERETTTNIEAPISGTVVQRFVYEGQYVKEGEKLFELADFTTMWFKFDAYDRDMPWLKQGQLVEVSTPSSPGKTFQARIAFIDPNVNDMTRSLKVRVEIPNPLVVKDGLKRRELFHRLYAEGRVRVEIPETLTIPRSAVLSPGGDPVVYIDHGNGHFEARKIKLGRAGDSDWEVLDGLTQGERVVSQGNLMIDAQAQLNAVATASANSASVSTDSVSPGHSHEPQKLNPPAPSGTSIEQARSLESLLKHAAALGEALASDDLSKFNELHSRSSEIAKSASNEMKSMPGWEDLASKLLAFTPKSRLPDIQSARKEFHQLSEPIVLVSLKARKQGDWKALKILQCPMVKTAFPGAPKTGVWIQWSLPVRNPYFGSEMIDCGTEVVP